MRAARANRYGGPDVLAIEEIERAPLEEGSVRVAVDAAAVNFPDLLMLANRYQVTIPLPYTPGAEFSGTVVEVGPLVTDLSSGMAVIGMATHGSFAEEVVIEAGRLTPIPASIDRHAAAAFGVTYSTAYHASRTIARVRAGEWVVVLAATGGVGLAAVDIAGALGARVFGAASNSERCAFLERRGVEGVCNYSTEDLKESIKVVTGGGAQVTIDPVGGPPTPRPPYERWHGVGALLSSDSHPVRFLAFPSTSSCSRGSYSPDSKTGRFPDTYPGLYPNTGVKCLICWARGASLHMSTPSTPSMMWPERSRTCKPDGSSAR